MVWDGSPDHEVTGYRVFRLAPDGLSAEAIGGVEPHDRDKMVLESGDAAGRYFVRGYGLQETPAGSFYTYSQGAYARRAEHVPPMVIKVSAEADQEIFVPLEHVENGRSYLLSILHPPETGRIAVVPGGWHYTFAEAGESSVRMPITLFDGQMSRRADLEIRIH